MSDRVNKISSIDAHIKHLSRPCLVKILHVLYSSINHKYILEKDGGIHVKYDNINDDLLNRIYEMVNSFEES